MVRECLFSEVSTATAALCLAIHRMQHVGVNKRSNPVIRQLCLFSMCKYIVIVIAIAMNNQLVHVCLYVGSSASYLLALALSVSSSSASSSSHDSQSTVINKQQNNKQTNRLNYLLGTTLQYICVHNHMILSLFSLSRALSPSPSSPLSLLHTHTHTHCHSLFLSCTH